MAYGDTIAYEFSEGAETRTLRLTYNALTYLKYKQFFDTDLLNDVLRLVNTSDIPKDMRAKIESGELDVDEIDDIDVSALPTTGIDTTVLLQIVVAMVATNECKSGKRRGAEEIMLDIPAWLMTDANFFTQVVDLLMFGLKKTQKA